MKRTIIIIIITVGFCLKSFGQSDLTAENILDNSIEFCGGIKNIMLIKNSSLVYDATTNYNMRKSIVIKKEVSQKYIESFLSDKYTYSTKYFNDSILTIVHGETKKEIKELDKIDKYKLETYNQPQYGYKELTYSLKRLEDQKFNHFDCYVVSATSKNGYTTLNYFDKLNFRLIMIIDPMGYKSIFMEYIFKDNVLFNTKILEVGEGFESTLTLTKIENNIKINPLWFQINNSKFSYENIRSGKFVASDGTILTKTDDVYTEKPKEGNSKRIYYIHRFDNYLYVMIDSEKRNKYLLTPPLELEDKIVVKIISWNNNGYVCHSLSNGTSGTQEYRIKK